MFSGWLTRAIHVPKNNHEHRIPSFRFRVSRFELKLGIRNRSLPATGADLGGRSRGRYRVS
jgi:hypothetical protein